MKIKNLVGTWSLKIKRSLRPKGLKRLFRTRRRKLLAASLAVLLLATTLQLFLLLRPARAGWSPSHTLWEKRKQLTISNDSTDSLASGTAVAITVNTKELYDAVKLQDDCDDLRIVYSTSSSNHKEIDRYLEFPSGTTCATSEATKVYLQLQAALTAGGSSTDYYMYYSNSKATPTVASFDTSSQTFTASMSKRSAPGPFTAAPIVQGDSNNSDSLTDDVLSFPRGTQISSNFYSNTDTEQGSVVLWWTPEYGSSDLSGTGDHYLFALNGQIKFYYEYDSDRFAYWHQGAPTYVNYSINAGSTYNFVVRWDFDNTLDGTNYVSVSINDAHTYGSSLQKTSQPPDTDLYVGDDRLAAGNATSGIIEGLTIYRRPLYDGLYGIGVGNGDEINQIWASGGQDPTLVTGSWDVVFALPTDSSTGALSTGTGEAWSHPHSSNLLYTDTTNTGGFMLNSTYTTDGWADELTPTTVAALATSEKIFAGGYKTTSDAVNEGIYYSETVTAGDDWVIRALGNSDGTCDPKVILYDQTGTAEIGSLTGTTTSDRDTPDVYLFTGEAPASSTELRVKLINTAASGTCYWQQVELLSNLLDEPSMESGSGDPWTPDGWTDQQLEAGDTEQETTIVHTGSSSIQYNSSTGGENINQNINQSEGDFAAYGLFAYGTGSDSIALRSVGSQWARQDTLATGLGEKISSASWTHVPGVVRRSSGVSSHFRIEGLSTGPSYADDAYAFLLTAVSLTVTPATITNSTESSGIRVDGRDTLTQTLTNITISGGTIKFKYTPRHDAADQLKFLESTDVYIAEFYGDADDYIRVYWNAANTITLAYSSAGSTGSGTWDATSAISADTTYELRIEYTGGGNMEFFVDGAKRITLSSIPAEFGVIPQTAYWGSRQNGDRQADATFAAPTNTNEVTDDVFDIGTKDALLVCPFDGSTTCAAGETPSTESGAIRYSGFKSALSFDGQGDSVYDLTDSTFLNSTDSVTAEVWVNVSNNLVNGTIIELCNSSLANCLDLLYLNTPNLALAIRVPGDATTYTVTSADVLTKGTWHHVALTYDSSGNYEIFVDGTSEGSGSQGTGLVDSKGRYRIGVGGTEYFAGVMDEVRVSNVIRYASNFTPTTNPFVRDEHTKILLHFDENGDDPRNTGKAIDDSGGGQHRDINGAKYVAGLVGVDPSTSSGQVPRQSYAGHEGIFIEEATTNKITNPSFDHATYNTNWTASGGTSSEETTAPYYKFGSKSYKLVLADVTDQNVYISINAGNTNTHTLSAYIYRGTSGSVGGTVDNTVAQLYWQGTAQSTTTYTDMGGGWWRMSYSAAGTASAQNYGVTVVEDSGTLYIDGVQLEELAYATTYTDGTLGTGYSWSGTAHNSTSSRTVENLQYANSGNIAASAGSVTFWVKPDWAGNDGVEHTFFDTDTSAGTLKLYKTTGNVLTLTDGTNTATSSISGWSKNDWHYVATTWDGAGFLDVYVDSTAGTGSVAFSAPTFTTSLYLGQNKSNATLVNASINDFRVWDTALTSAEITDLYQAGLVSRQEGIEVDRFSDEKGQNPVAIYHFDESYGTTANDSSQYGNNLTVSGATWETQSVGGRSQLERNLKFDGTNDYASRTWDRDFNFGTGSFSISGWFRHPSTASGTDVLLARYGSGGYKVYMDSSGYVCFGIDDDSTWTPADSACSTTSYADSRWYHFEAVKQGSTSLTLYVNGNAVASDATISATGSLNSSAPLYIGIDSDGTSNPWDGFLDEIVIYPYARDASQVKEDFLGSQTAQVYGASAEDFLTEGLVGYWNLDETSDGSGAVTRADSSGNGNDMTDNSPFAASAAGKFGNSTQFVAANSEYLSIADNTILSAGNNNVTYTAWVNLDSLGTQKMFVSKWGTNPEKEFYLSTTGSNKFSFVWANDAAGSSTQIDADTFGAAQAGIWYFVTAYHDVSKNEIGISVNGGVFDTSTVTGGNDGTDSFLIGAHSSGTPPSSEWNGEIDEVRMYKRVLSPAEISALYSWGPGPVGYWNFDEGSGTTLYDRSGNGNNGTLETSMTEDDWVNGKFGKALEFDGSDDKIDAGSASTLDDLGPLTFEAWINPNSLGGEIEFINKGVNTRFTADSTTQISFRRAYSTTGLRRDSASSTLTSAEWQHIAVTWDGTTSASNVRIYRNGVEVNYSSTIDGAGTLTSDATDNLTIAGRTSAAHLNGLVDEARIYNYARTQSQIIEDMNAGHPVGGSPLPSQIGYWSFDEGYGDTANDSGTGGNNGDLAGSGTTCPQSADSACPSWTNSGKFGKALDFDTAGATDDYVDVAGSSIGNDTAFSVTGWFKTSMTANGNIYAEGRTSTGTPYFFIAVNENATGDLVMGLRDDSNTDGEVAPGNINANDGNWHHFAAVENSKSSRELYLDGVSLGTNSTTLGTITLDTNNIGVVQRTSFTEYFDGQIDEIKIYNVALTADQVALDYNQGKAAVWGATSTDSSGNATWSAANEYCPPGQGSTCTPPVGEWKFDEKTGTTANDTSGNGNTGTLTNAPTWQHAGQCRKGACLNFSGSNDKIDVSYNSVFDVTNLTLETWIKPETVSGTQVLVCKNRLVSSNNCTYSVRLENDEIRFESNYLGTVQVVTTTNANLTVGNWYHVATTFEDSSNTTNIYLNGVLLTNDTTTITQSFETGDSDLEFGEDNSVRNYNGAMDDIKIYNYARTPAQIAWDYNRGEAIGYWKLDECQGTVANDSGSGGNDGTITIGSSGTNTSAGTCSSGTATEAWNNGTTGKRNASLDFDGTDDYVDLGTMDVNSGSITLSAWFNSDNLEAACGASNSDCRIISKASSTTDAGSWWMLGTVENPSSSDNVYLRFRLKTGSTTTTLMASSGTLSTNTWYHAAAVYDGSNMILYLNGVNVGSTAKTGTVATDNTIATAIARNGSETTNDWDGQIDEVKIFNYALTQEQIRNEYNQGAIRFGP